MQNIPTLRLTYANRLLERLASVGPATPAELVDGSDPGALFKGDGPHRNPQRRAQDILRHARLLALVEQISGGKWALTDRGAQYVAALDPDDPWSASEAQQRVLFDGLIAGATGGDPFVTDVATALSLLKTADHPRPVELARGLAVITGSAQWEAERTFQSQGDRYTALLQDTGLVDNALGVTALGEQFLSRVEVPSHPPLADLLSESSNELPTTRWWWVNQGRTWRAEFEEAFLWAPLLSKNGLKQHHWERLDEVRPGDRVIHYSGAIRAVSVVQESAVEAPKPASIKTDAWEQKGRLVRTQYSELAQAIPLADIPSSWRQAEEGGPFTQAGAVQQGYFFPISDEFVGKLLQRFEELQEVVGFGVEFPLVDTSLESVYAQFRDAVDESGLLIPSGRQDRVRAVLAALVAKPFVILSGLSGSGKTQLALRLGEWFGSSMEGPRALVVPVQPDWTGPEALFGYEDALTELKDGGRAWHVPESLAFMLRAAQEPERPYLLVLDEMNLAHVERYFADFLSGVESGKGVLPDLSFDGREWRLNPASADRLPLPQNLFVIGTVNVDETTYLFSPKVLDRAFTFEVRTATAELENGTLAKPSPVLPADEHLLAALVSTTVDAAFHLEHPHPKQAELRGALLQLHSALSVTGDEFGHRVMYEALRFAAALAASGEDDPLVALDYIVLLKLLPRIHGARRRVEPVLRRLARFSEEPKRIMGELDGDPEPDSTSAALSMSHEKLLRMLEAVRINQFVSFSE